MPNGVDILQLNTVTSTSNADKLYVHQNDTLVQVTKSNFMSEINNNIADEYDSTSTYVQGDYCMYNGQLYVCTTTISTSEEWNSSHWTSTTCADGFNANGIPMSEKGSANGVAELDANGKVPTSQLPSYVDDVLEYSSLSAFPSTGETGKIYIALDTNLTYRWSGTVYVEISPSLALGETSSTAYRGDRGATAYTHSQTTSGNPHNVTKSDVGLGNVENFKAVSTEENQGLTNTEQSNAKDNLGLSTVATSGSYTDLTDTPTVDTALDPTSTNAVQNKAIAHELAGGNTQASGDVVTITDGSNLALTSATSTLAPIQDLHGYSNPWVGGAGKNLIPMTVESIKSANTSGTWSGNVYTLNDVTFELLTDNASNITGIKVNSTGASARTDLQLSVTNAYLSSGNYIVNGCPNGGGNNKYRIILWDDTTQTAYNDYGDGVTASVNSGDNLVTIITIYQGQTANNLVFYPMIRLATVTDATFAPYTNICPISGYDSAEYTRTGVNLFDKTKATNGKLVDNTGNLISNSTSSVSDYIKVSGNTTYYLSNVIGANSYYTTACYDKDKNFIENKSVNGSGNVSGTITFSENTEYIRVNLETTYIDETCINLSNPLYNGNYYPYQGQAITLTFDNTIYSGVIDWCTGVVTVDKASKTFTEVQNKNTAVIANDVYVVDTITDGVAPTSTTIAGDFITNEFKATSLFETTNNAIYGAFMNSTKILQIGMPNSTTTSVNTYLASNPLQIVYQLATPTTIQLTPTQLKTLAGYNTIYTDVGNISIAYQPNNVIAECKEYTDNAIPTIDSELDDTSLNPIANKPVAEAIADIVGDISDIDSNIEGSKQLTTTGNIITVSDSAATYLEELEVDIEPIQDLHGYDYPWVGGAGKNLLPMTIEGIKSANTSGTWNNNIYTLNNVTFELLTDSASNITGIKVSGTANNATSFTLYDQTTTYNANSYILNGCPSGGDTNTYSLQLYRSSEATIIETGSGRNVNIDNVSKRFYYFIYIANGTTIATPITFYPMIRLASITDPTFAPYSNICPISGYDSTSYNRCGVNIWDEVAESGRIDATTGVNVTDAGWIRSKNYIKVKPNTVYYFSIPTTYTTGRMAIYDENKNFIQWSVMSYNATYTMPQNAGYIRITFGVTTYNNDISINYPSTITTYQPYQGQTYTVSFVDDQAQSMTVYSGTLDVTTGVLVVDKAMVDLGDLSWSVMSGQTNTFYTSLTNAGNYYAVCSQYRNVGNQPYLEMINGTIQVRSDYTYIRDNNYTDATTFATAMDGVQLVYELATPQTIQLTPQQLQMLKGYNTVTTDANGGMTIKYQPDNVVGEIKAYASRLYDDIIRRLNELSS